MSTHYAERALRMADEVASDGEVAITNAILEQATQTERLADEQRTANLIALLASDGAWTQIGFARKDDITDLILVRLGLAS